MGERADWEFNKRARQVHGKGTTLAHVWHPNPDESTVVAPPGSVARLWNMSDPNRPVDRGLYFFPFVITWATLGSR